MNMTTGLAAPLPDPDKENPPRNTVLVADDDPIFRRVLQSSLEKWNYKVVTVGNGDDAWKILQEPNAPQMAVLDWMMPGSDGIEICRKLRSQQEGPYRYVLLITAKDNKQDVVAGLEAGADDYLTKPFDLEELHARIRAGERILELQEALLQAHVKLQFEADHDALTAIWNRRAILELLKREISRLQRTGQPLGLIMVDLDHFKQINDSYGHLAGDAVLRQAAQRMLNCMRVYDTVGRYGGEEFMVVVPGCNENDLLGCAERIRLSIAEKPIAIDGAELSVTLSLGLVTSQSGSGNLLNCESMIHAADTALYRAKSNGRNRTEIADTTNSSTGA
jgi:two-component system cell cycle response regulator